MNTTQDELASHGTCETCSAKTCSCFGGPCAGRVLEAPSPMRGITTCGECLADWTAAAEHEKAERRAGGPSDSDLAEAFAVSGHDVKNCSFGGCGACEAAMDALDDARCDAAVKEMATREAA